MTVLLALVLNLCLLPTLFHPFDIFTYWTTWASGSHGSFPWLIYRDRPTCDYPAVWPYLLTILERIRLTLGWAGDDMSTVYLFKLPGMIGHLIGIPVVYNGLRRVVPGNGRVARRAAFLYALCPALLVNGVLWGQIDSLLSLGMIGATLALMNRRPLAAGLWFGFALSVKLQAIIILPALLVYAARTLRPRQLLAATGAALALIAALALPYVVAGTGKRWLGTYTTSVGRYPNRTVSAANPWMVVALQEAQATGKTLREVNRDTGRILRSVPVTERQFGLALFAVAIVVILTLLGFRIEPVALPLAASASVWAFYLLCTQMHERYGLPAAALLTLCLGGFCSDSRHDGKSFSANLLVFVVWCGVAFSSAWNQFLVLSYDYHNVLRLPQPSYLLAWEPTMWALPFVNIALLVTLIWQLRNVPSQSGRRVAPATSNP